MRHRYADEVWMDRGGQRRRRFHQLDDFSLWAIFRDLANRSYMNNRDHAGQINFDAGKDGRNFLDWRKVIRVNKRKLEKLVVYATEDRGINANAALCAFALEAVTRHYERVFGNDDIYQLEVAATGAEDVTLSFLGIQPIFRLLAAVTEERDHLLRRLEQAQHEGRGAGRLPVN